MSGIQRERAGWGVGGRERTSGETEICLEVDGQTARYTDQPQGRYLTVTGLLSDGLKREVTLELRLEWRGQEGTA